MASVITFSQITHFFTLLLTFLSISIFTATEAYDPLDPNGNITIKWDIFSWTPDGYVADVTIYNYQRFRHIQAPGWTLGWTWAKEEVIWATVGARAKQHGDCSRFKGNIPASCKEDPKLIDMPPKTPYNMQIANCCRGGVISTTIQDPANAASSFQLTVGSSANTNKTVKLPKNFTLTAPGGGYVCGAAKIQRPTTFITSDGRRMTQALMTWSSTCTYPQFLAEKTPTCCVALSAFYNRTAVDCPRCACGCRKSSTARGTCVKKNAGYLASTDGLNKSGFVQSVLQCTPHMCPVRVHWHVKQNLEKYWRVKVTITNFNRISSYSEWNLAIQHPNFNNLARAFGFNYKSLTGYTDTNGTAMIWGIKHYNDVLRKAGRYGHVQGEVLFRKRSSAFTLRNVWGFPLRVNFNGNNCVMPPRYAYP